MARKKTPTQIVYWDACVFIGWLKPARYTPEIQNGALTILQSAEARKVNLVTSVLTIAEVQDAIHDPIFGERFDELFLRENFNYINVDESIARLAQKIGHQYRIKPPDAIHIASAIDYSANCLYTLDGLKAVDSGSGSKILSHAEAIQQDYGLRVEAPYAELPEPGLFDRPNL